MRFVFLFFVPIFLFANSFRYDSSLDMMMQKKLNSHESMPLLQKTLTKTIGGNCSPIETEHFKIYYGDVNPGTTLWNDTDSNGYADFLDILKTELEVIWDKEVVGIGLKQPTFSNKIEILVSDTGLYLNGSLLTLNNSGTVGYSVYDEATSEIYMVINGTIGYYNGTSGEDMTRITLAHEFFHLIQYAYFWDFDWADVWLYEGFAVWMEYQVYPDIDDYIKTYGDYVVGTLTKGIIEEAGIYPYATNGFVDYIAHITTQSDFAKKVWQKMETYKNSIKAMESYLNDENKTLSSVLIDYATSLKNEDETKFTNAKLLFDTIGNFSNYYCNQSNYKNVGYYSVLVLGDENEFDDCNVFDIETSYNKTIILADDTNKTTGVRFNTKESPKAVVLMPTNSVTTNSEYSVTFKMLEQKSLDVKSGWNLLGAYSDINVSNSHESIKTIWVYDDGWKVYAKDSALAYVYDTLPKLEIIKAGQGFWVNSYESAFDVLDNSYTQTQVCDFDIKSGWNLISNKCIDSDNLSDIISKYNLQNAWMFEDGKWLLKQLTNSDNWGFESFDLIKSNLGYWFYK